MPATTWILDVNHRARRLEHEVPEGVRPLAAAAAAARGEGIALEGGPVGVRGREVMFLTPDSGAGRWPPLAEWAAADERGWRLYVDVMLGGWEPPTRELDVFHFGMVARMAAHLAHMVVMGPKRGTAGWAAAAARDGSTIPHVGLVSIVTNARKRRRPRPLGARPGP